MKTGEVIKEGTILVAKFAELAICGRTVIREGSILKVAHDSLPYKTNIRVYRNKHEYDIDDWRTIDRANVREANEIEISMWNKEMYFVEKVKTF